MISFPPIFSDKNPFSYANLRVALRQVRDRAGAAQLALLAVHFFNFVLKHTLRFYAKKKNSSAPVRFFSVRDSEVNCMCGGEKERGRGGGSVEEKGESPPLPPPPPFSPPLLLHEKNDTF